MCSLFDSDSRELLVLAVVLAVLLAQDQDEIQIAKMAAFFTIVGDTLALFSLQPGLFSCCKELLPALIPQPKPCGDQEAQPPK